MHSAPAATLQTVSFRGRNGAEMGGKTGEPQRSSRDDTRAASKPLSCLEHDPRSREGGAGVQSTRFDSWPSPWPSPLGPADTRSEGQLTEAHSKRSDVRFAVPKKVFARQSQSDPGRRHSPQTLRWVFLARPSKSAASRNSSPAGRVNQDNIDQRYEATRSDSSSRGFDRVVGTIKVKREEKLPSFLAGFPTYL